MVCATIESSSRVTKLAGGEKRRQQTPKADITGNGGKATHPDYSLKNKYV